LKSVIDLDQITEYVLGVLPEDERRELGELIAVSPSLQREVARVAEALASTADMLTPVPPPASMRARLLGTVQTVDRFAPFFDDLVRLFELPRETLRSLLARVDEERRAPLWEKTLCDVELHGIELFHFPVGPALAATGAAGGVLSIRSGVTFPPHRHHGDETTYVLEGRYIAGGHSYGPGSIVPAAAGTSHEYRSGPERDLVIIVLHRGITLLSA
jgi:quercetin dioxygenase-like cupin family protein